MFWPMEEFFIAGNFTAVDSPCRRDSVEIILALINL